MHGVAGVEPKTDVRATHGAAQGVTFPEATSRYHLGRRESPDGRRPTGRVSDADTASDPRICGLFYEWVESDERSWRSLDWPNIPALMPTMPAARPHNRWPCT